MYPLPNISQGKLHHVSDRYSSPIACFEFIHHFNAIGTDTPKYTHYTMYIFGHVMPRIRVSD
jgi:hypothetical protein